MWDTERLPLTGSPFLTTLPVTSHEVHPDNSNVLIVSCYQTQWLSFRNLGRRTNRAKPRDTLLGCTPETFGTGISPQRAAQADRENNQANLAYAEDVRTRLSVSARGQHKFAAAKGREEQHVAERISAWWREGILSAGRRPVHMVLTLAKMYCEIYQYNLCTVNSQLLYEAFQSLQ